MMMKMTTILYQKNKKSKSKTKTRKKKPKRAKSQKLFKPKKWNH